MTVLPTTAAPAARLHASPPEPVLPEGDWRAREAGHQEAVDDLVGDRLARRREGRAHPVEDFLFDYYAFRPAQLRRWHPGAGVALEGATEHPAWTGYATDGRLTWVDVETVLAKRGSAVRAVRTLLTATLGRPARFGCFGLHEWAMVHRLDQGEVRHPSWPLRLGREGTDAVVEGHQIACSHFDAYRFFTDSARPLNTLRPTRETQPALEQSGCLHAGMDVYKWCFTLTPLVPSALTLDAFGLAREIRELDMRAAPYDLRALGYEPVRIETAEGKAEYVAAQRGFAERADLLRRRLLDVLTPLDLPHARRDDARP